MEMNLTNQSIPRVCSPSIQEKAKRLDIVMLTPFVSLVEGDHDTYMVWRDTLACSCPAGAIGRYCSHAEAVNMLRRTPPPKVTRRYCVYDPATGDLAVWENGVVIGHCRTYPEMGDIHG